MLFSACNKSDKPCNTSTEITNNGHLVDISMLQTAAPQFLDSLNKYPMLQVAQIRTGDGNVRMDCNVYHQGVRMFFTTYGLLKSPNSSQVSVVGNNVTDFNLNIALQPSITGLQAVDITKNEIAFGVNCIDYTLGVIDLNSILGQSGVDYKLVWHVGSITGGMFAYIDAQTGAVLYSFNGFIE